MTVKNNFKEVLSPFLWYYGVYNVENFEVSNRINFVFWKNKILRKFVEFGDSEFPSRLLKFSKKLQHTVKIS